MNANAEARIAKTNALIKGWIDDGVWPVVIHAPARAYLAASNAGVSERKAYANALKAHPLAFGDESTLLAHLRLAGAMI